MPNKAEIKLVLFLAFLHSLLPIIGFVVYNNLGQREIAIENTKRETSNLVKFASFNYRQQIDAAKYLLLHISTLHEIGPDHKTGCNDLFVKLLERYPMYANIGATDINGDLYCSAIPTQEILNASDRLWFTKALESQAFSVGEYQIGKATQKPSINFSYPLYNSDQTLTGVVFVALDLKWFESLVSSLSLPPDSVIGVVDHEGHLLARQPQLTEGSGQIEPDTQLLSNMLSQTSSTPTVSTNGPDKIKRHYSYTTLHNGSETNGIYLYIGIPEYFFEKNPDFVLKRNLIVAGILTFVGLIVGYIDWQIILFKQGKLTVDKS